MLCVGTLSNAKLTRGAMAAAANLGAAAAAVAGAAPFDLGAAQALVAGVANPADRLEQLRVQRHNLQVQRAALVREERNERKRQKRLMDKARSLSNEGLLQILATRVHAQANGKGKANGKGSGAANFTTRATAMASAWTLSRARASAKVVVVKDLKVDVIDAAMITTPKIAQLQRGPSMQVPCGMRMVLSAWLAS